MFDAEMAEDVEAALYQAPVLPFNSSSTTVANVVLLMNSAGIK
jgi:hypothetical protein